MLSEKYVLEQIAQEWKTTGASPEDITACGGTLECWTYFSHDETPLSLQVTTGERSDWQVRGEEPLGPRDDAAVTANLEFTRGLLSALVDGMASGVVVIAGVPTERFRASSPLFATVDFARRALPPAFRNRARIRCFTRNPRRFLDEFRADLMVIPRQLAADAMALRRDAILLDENGQRVSGIAERTPDYARFACEQFASDPSTFDGFLERANRFIPAIPTTQQASLLPLLGVLARGTANVDLPAGLESLAVEWDAIFRPADWALLTSESVFRVALTVPGLRGPAIAEIERRRSRPPTWVDWDREVSERPQAAVDVLLASSSWQTWHERTSCSKAQLHAAALHWCASAYWSTNEPHLENWVAITRDLQQGISAADLRVMSGAGARRHPFPPISFFEDRQAADIKRLSTPSKPQDDTQIDPAPPVRQDQPVVLFGASSDEAAAGARTADGWWWRDEGIRVRLGASGIRIEMPASQPARQGYVLERGAAPALVTIKSEMTLPPGQRLLLPVSADAESRLHTFVQGLSHLPSAVRDLLCGPLPEPETSAREDQPDEEPESGFLGGFFRSRKSNRK